MKLKRRRLRRWTEQPSPARKDFEHRQAGASSFLASGAKATKTLLAPQDKIESFANSIPHFQAKIQHKI
jgi:hypothetical protein